MPANISLSCRACGISVQVPAATAGRKARCTRCDACFQIPPLAQLDQPTAQLNNRDALDSSPAVSDRIGSSSGGCHFVEQV